jgi:hypothetical protein
MLCRIHCVLVRNQQSALERRCDTPFGLCMGGSEVSRGVACGSQSAHYRGQQQFSSGTSIVSRRIYHVLNQLRLA